MEMGRGRGRGRGNKIIKENRKKIHKIRIIKIK
jgi:hypothetical protein